MRRINENVAQWLITFGMHLVRHGLGNTAWTPENDTDEENEALDFHGFIDEVPGGNQDMYRWMSDIIRFVKVVVGILQYNDENDDPQLDPRLLDDNEV